MNKQFRLPKDFAQEWLNALRSGEYKQSRGSLYDRVGKGFCCLGVACMIKYHDIKYLKDLDENMAGLISRDESDTNNSYFTDMILDKIPIEIRGGICYNMLVYELTAKNDTGESFEKIADWIEKNVEFYE